MNTDGTCGERPREVKHGLVVGGFRGELPRPEYVRINLADDGVKPFAVHQQRYAADSADGKK